MTAICAGTWVTASMVLVAVCSCDRLKSAAEGVRKKARDTAAEVGGKGGKNGMSGNGTELGGAADPELEKLVDRTDAGYRFRRDLPFPDKVRCRVATVTKYVNGRVFARSALGRTSQPLDGTSEDTLVVERDGGVVAVKVERNRLNKPVLEGGKAPAKAKAGTEGAGASQGNDQEGLSATFARRTDGWHRRGGGDDFRTMAWATEMAPDIEDNLPRWGAVPRSPWFGEQRLQPGAEVKLEGAQVALVTASMVKKGEVKLRFDSVAAVGGHPCAVFTWSGEFSDEGTDLNGVRVNADVSVDEGRLWCSLIHPLVLRSESIGAVTSVILDGDGKLKTRVQGGAEVTATWEWQPL